MTPVFCYESDIWVMIDLKGRKNNPLKGKSFHPREERSGWEQRLKEMCRSRTWRRTKADFVLLRYYKIKKQIFLIPRIQKQKHFCFVTNFNFLHIKRIIKKAMWCINKPMSICLPKYQFYTLRAIKWFLPSCLSVCIVCHINSALQPKRLDRFYWNLVCMHIFDLIF